MAGRREPLREVHGLSSPEVSRVQDGVREALRPLQSEERPRRDTWLTAQDQTATTVTAETPIWISEFDGLLVGLTYTGSSAMTANGTDFATFIFRLRDGSGGGTAAQIARYRTADGSIRAFKPHEFTLGGDRKLKTGSVLTMEVIKAGAGRSISPGHVSIFYTERSA